MSNPIHRVWVPCVVGALGLAAASGCGEMPGAAHATDSLDDVNASWAADHCGDLRSGDLLGPSGDVEWVERWVEVALVPGTVRVVGEIDDSLVWAHLGGEAVELVPRTDDGLHVADRVAIPTGDGLAGDDGLRVAIGPELAKILAAADGQVLIGLMWSPYTGGWYAAPAYDLSAPTGINRLQSCGDLAARTRQLIDEARIAGLADGDDAAVLAAIAGPSLERLEVGSDGVASNEVVPNPNDLTVNPESGSPWELAVVLEAASGTDPRFVCFGQSGSPRCLPVRLGYDGGFALDPAAAVTFALVSEPTSDVSNGAAIDRFDLEASGAAGVVVSVDGDDLVVSSD